MGNCSAVTKAVPFVSNNLYCECHIFSTLFAIFCEKSKSMDECELVFTNGVFLSQILV